MQRVYYAGADFLMADDAAVALLDFAALIAGAGQAQHVPIPVVVDGAESTFHAIVGPASQILIAPASSLDADPEVAAFVQDMTDRSVEYRRARALVGEQLPAPSDELE